MNWSLQENVWGELLKRSSPRTPFKNFQKKMIYQCFLKVLGTLKPFFQKGFKPPEAALPLPCKPEFCIMLCIFAYFQTN